MFTYLITFSDGSQKTQRANSPKDAYEFVKDIKEVAHIKFLRGK